MKIKIEIAEAEPDELFRFNVIRQRFADQIEALVRNR